MAEHCQHASLDHGQTYRCARGLFGGRPHVGVCRLCLATGGPDGHPRTRVSIRDVIAGNREAAAGCADCEARRHARREAAAAKMRADTP
jgi:hypothetical protein